MDKIKMLVDVVKAVNENRKITADDLKVDKEEFGSIVEIAIDEGYIKGANVTRSGQGNKVNMIWLESAKITLKGLEFLESRAS